MSNIPTLTPFLWKKKPTHSTAPPLTQSEIHQLAVSRSSRSQNNNNSTTHTSQNATTQQPKKESQESTEKEQQYHIETAKERALLRIEQNRYKAIDKLVIILETILEPEKYAMKQVQTRRNGYKINEHPYMIIKQLTLAQLLETKNEIHFFTTMEKREEAIKYWKNSVIIVDNAIQVSQNSALNQAVAAQTQTTIAEMLQDKTYDELIELQDEIEQHLESDDPGDLEYWQYLYEQSFVYKARALLITYHKQFLELRERYKDRVDKDVNKIDDDVQQLDHVAAETKTNEPEAPLPLVASSHLEEDEAVFSSEVALPLTHYSWEDRHRPRKPKYFNRVQTGFEWNKYNQTHYDHDNPPPKVVQGYKFNIFYPDLINKDASPTYKILHDKDEEEYDQDESEQTCVIIFKAGPPYEVC